MKIFIYLTFFAMIFLMTVQISGNTADRKLQNSGIVSLKASETKEINPDLAKVIISIENTGNNVEKVTLDNANTLVKIADALKNEINLNENEIKTSPLSIYPVYGKNKNQIKYYQAKTNLTAETKDLNNVSRIKEVAIQNGAAKVNNVVYEIQNEKESCKNIYPEIIKELRSQADDIAQINDQFVIGVKNIDLKCNSNVYSTAKSIILKDTITNARREAESVSTEAGKIKVTATVEAKYTISR